MVHDVTYSYLCRFNTFEERFKLLISNGVVGEETFGWERYLNQTFYRSNEWKNARAQVIVRDNGCDLGLPDYPIADGNKIIVHHIIPITREMVLNHDSRMTDPEYLICVSHRTHNAITYGDINYVFTNRHKERTPNDTMLWKSIR